MDYFHQEAHTPGSSCSSFYTSTRWPAVPKVVPRALHEQILPSLQKNWCRLKEGSVPGCSSAHTELAARAGLQLPLPGGSILTATNTIPYMPAQMAAVIHQGRPGRWCKFYSLNRSALTVWYCRNVPRPLAARFGGQVSLNVSENKN